MDKGYVRPSGGGARTSLAEVKAHVDEAIDGATEVTREAVGLSIETQRLRMRSAELFAAKSKTNGHGFVGMDFPSIPDPLTNREMEVLSLLADGKSSREIAKLLGIAFKTATCHRANIMQKLDVHEEASLVRRAIRLGLIES